MRSVWSLIIRVVTLVVLTSSVGLGCADILTGPNRARRYAGRAHGDGCDRAARGTGCIGGEPRSPRGDRYRPHRRPGRRRHVDNAQGWRFRDHRPGSKPALGARQGRSRRLVFRPCPARRLRRVDRHFGRRRGDDARSIGPCDGLRRPGAAWRGSLRDRLRAAPGAAPQGAERVSVSVGAGPAQGQVDRTQGRRRSSTPRIPRRPT